MTNEGPRQVLEIRDLPYLDVGILVGIVIINGIRDLAIFIVGGRDSGNVIYNNQFTVRKLCSYIFSKMLKISPNSDLTENAAFSSTLSRGYFNTAPFFSIHYLFPVLFRRVNVNFFKALFTTQARDRDRPIITVGITTGKLREFKITRRKRRPKRPSKSNIAFVETSR